MKISKIVDTIPNYGAAESYISLEASFVRFLRNKYGRNEILNVSSADQLSKKFSLKGFVFGNYVTQEERFFLLFKIEKQLEALAKIRGKNNLGYGELIIAFGVEGKPRSAAHFNPSKQLINLNRGRKADYDSILQGENSFVHEYGHFLDFKTGRSDGGIETNFACEVSENSEKGNPMTKEFARVVNKIEFIEEYMESLDSEYLRRRVEIFARYFEAAITYHIQDNVKSHAKYFDRTYKQRRYLSKDQLKQYKLTSSAITILKKS